MTAHAHHGSQSGPNKCHSKTNKSTCGRFEACFAGGRTIFPTRFAGDGSITGSLASRLENHRDFAFSALPEQETPRSFKMSSFPPNSLTPSTGRVLLIGWDAADWKIITPMLERGEMPHLQRLMRRGVSGDLLTLRPVLSPMLWNSIATGHRPERHGVHGFTEIDPVTGAVRPVTSLSRKCKALWNMVTQSGGRAHVANWYASWPAEPIRGICVSESLARQTDQTLSPPQPGAVHPRERTEELAALRMGLHEVDEATMRLFVPLLHLADQRREGERLTDLARLIAESFTVHKMASRLVRDHPWNLTAVYYPGIDHFCHGFMNFHPPRMADVSDHDFKLYQHVIAAAYRLHDAFLGRLIQLAGPDTTVMLVSDHGFHSGGLRRREVDDDNPVAAAQHHRENGILEIGRAHV